MSAPGSRALAAACVGVLWTAATGVAFGTPSSGAPAAQRSVLLLAASEPEQQALESVKADLRELVEPVTLRTPPSGRSDRSSLSHLTEEHHALAAVWLDQSSSRFVVVYVFDPQSQRLGMRRLPRRSQADADESVGVVLRATLEALLEGREAPLEVVALPAEPAPKPVPIKRAPKQERASLRTGYVGVGFASSSLEHGASLGGGLSLTRLLRVGLGYAILQPAELSAAQASVTLTRHPLDLFLSLGANLGPFELYGEAGSSLDFRLRRSEVSDSGLRASEDAGYAVVSVLGRLKLARELLPQLRFDIGPALELPLNEPDLVVDRSASDASLAHFHVRPRFEAGVSLVIR